MFTPKIYTYIGKGDMRQEQTLVQKAKHDSHSALDCLSVGPFGRVLLSDTYSLTQVKCICNFTTATSRKMSILQKFL